MQDDQLNPASNDNLDTPQVAPEPPVDNTMPTPEPVAPADDTSLGIPPTPPTPTTETLTPDGYSTPPVSEPLTPPVEPELPTEPTVDTPAPEAPVAPEAPQPIMQPEPEEKPGIFKRMFGSK